MNSPRSPFRLFVAAALGVLILATAGGTVWYVLANRKAPSHGGKVGGDHPVTLDLKVTRVTVRSVAETLSKDQIAAATVGVHDAVQDLYLGAFVDPSRWHDGAFPDAFNDFEPAAADRARTELNALTLGDAAKRVEWVDPQGDTFSIVFLLDANNAPVTAVAGVVFRATGHLRDGGTVDIQNGADLFLRPVDGQWRVYSYTASTTVQPPDAGASSSPSGSGG